MAETEIRLNLQGNDRKTIRDNLIIEFLKEEPGTGSGDLSTKYYYYVETTGSDIYIYLNRPARLNKGMDFEVHADNVKFDNESESGRTTKSSRPSHKTILTDLKRKKEENPEEYVKMKVLIDKIYNCEIVADQHMRELNFNSGHHPELILKIIKWLFIEQDMTYWNWSGRAMFYSGINDI
jgi:hypothetical protein